MAADSGSSKRQDDCDLVDDGRLPRLLWRFKFLSARYKDSKKHSAMG